MQIIGLSGCEMKCCELKFGTMWDVVKASERRSSRGNFSEK